MRPGQVMHGRRAGGEERRCREQGHQKVRPAARSCDGTAGSRQATAPRRRPPPRPSSPTSDAGCARKSDVRQPFPGEPLLARLLEGKKIVCAGPIACRGCIPQCGYASRYRRRPAARSNRLPMANTQIRIARNRQSESEGTSNRGSRPMAGRSVRLATMLHGSRRAGAGRLARKDGGNRVGLYWPGGAAPNSVRNTVSSPGWSGWRDRRFRRVRGCSHCAGTWRAR